MKLLSTLIFLSFSLICAISDARSQSVRCFVFCLSAASGLLISWLDRRPCPELFCAALPGLSLLLLSLVPGHFLGAGDGAWFLTAAAFLSFPEVLLILMLSLFLTAAAALILAVVSAGFRKQRTLPFLCFTFPAAVFVLLLHPSLTY